MRTLRHLMTYAIAAALAGAAVYFWRQHDGSGVQVPPTPVQAEASPGRKSSESAVRYPVPGPGSQSHKGASAADADNKPLPAVDDSDPTMQEAIARILAGHEHLFQPKDLIRRIVVTIDNLTEPRQSPSRFLPVKSPEGVFRATQTGDGQFALSQANFARYSPYVALVKSVDLKKVVALYVRFYSLFQSAYDDLGRKGYFNDRLVEVIDNLLVTPDVSAPVVLKLPSVYYKFADSDLEGMQSGQKLLIRIGPDNGKTVKTKLRRLRELLTSLPTSGT